jgi:hypothetical protein
MPATSANIPCANGVQYNPDQRLYVIPSGGGYSTMSPEYCAKRATAVRAWYGDGIGLSPDMDPGELWNAYTDTMDKAFKWHKEIGKQCPVELTPALIGLEGRRVAVRTPDGNVTRFRVSRSSGWMPCHIALANSRSTGGPPVYMPAGSTLHTID